MSKDVIFSLSYFSLNRTKEEEICHSERPAPLSASLSLSAVCECLFGWIRLRLFQTSCILRCFFLPGVEFKCLPTWERNLSASLCFIWLLLCVTADTSALWFTGICFWIIWCDVRKTYWARNKSCQAFFYETNLDFDELLWRTCVQPLLKAKLSPK